MLNDKKDILVVFCFISDVMINHVISTCHMSSLVLLILLKTDSIGTASHLYSTRSFVVAENVTRVILAGLSLNVHHAKPYFVGIAPECLNMCFEIDD